MNSIVDRLRTKAQEIAREGYKVLSFELQQIVRDIQAVRHDLDAQFRDIVDERDVAKAAQKTYRGGTAKQWYEKKEEAYREATKQAERADDAESKAAQLEAEVARLDAALSIDNCRSAG